MMTTTRSASETSPRLHLYKFRGVAAPGGVVYTKLTDKRPGCIKRKSQDTIPIRGPPYYSLMIDDDYYNLILSY